MTKETFVKIAVRVPPGDQWVLVGQEELTGIPHASIVEALSEYCRITGFMGNYKLCPMEPQTENASARKGVLYAIKEEEVEVRPKGYNIYGEEI